MAAVPAEASRRDRTIRLVLRLIAVAIAVAAVIDPVITSPRRAKPLIAVVPVDRVSDSALAARVVAALADDYTVFPARLGIADATVLVGVGLPASDDGVTRPTVAVYAEAAVRIEHVSAPLRSSLHAPAQVRTTLLRAAGFNSPVAVQLLANGVIVDQQRVVFPDGASRHQLSLSFVPSAPGAVALRVRVQVASANPGAGGQASTTDALAHVDHLLEVHDQRRRVLVFDARPSFMSTFVRRALERDTRLLVESRVITSRDVSTSTGTPPERLSNRAAGHEYDVLVIGAPQVLTSAEVAALETFLRERGGSVLLLLDAAERGAYEQLLGVTSWRSRRVDRGAIVRWPSHDQLTLRAAEHYWPSTLRPGARVVALGAATHGDSAVARDDAAPLLWRASVGVGEVLVSGALDAWRYRDSELSGFDRVWPQLVFEAAGRAVPEISITLDRSVLAPGEQTGITVVVRDAALGQRVQRGAAFARANAPIAARLSAAEATVLAALEVARHAERDSSDSAESEPSEVVPLRLLPSGPAGVLRGVVRAPFSGSSARVVVSVNNRRVSVPLAIDAGRGIESTDNRELLSAWTTSRGGWAMSERELSTLASRLSASLEIAARPAPWRPMRSLWWMLPFALALSAEWWLRRRGGLA